MLNVEHFAITLGRTLDLIRSGADKDEQKTALRALVALTKLDVATVSCQDGALSIGDAVIPQTLPHIKVLTQQLAAHRVSQVAIARDAAPADLLNLLRALAADAAGGADIAQRLHEAQVATISVFMGGAATKPRLPPPLQAPPRRAASITQAFDQASILALAGEAPGAPTFTPRVESPAAPAPAPAAPARAPLDPLAQLNANPSGDGLQDRLDAVAEVVRDAVERGAMVKAVTTLASVVRREGGLPDGEVKRTYAAAIKQMVTKYVLSQVARMVLDPHASRDALQVIRRMGVEGRDAVLELLGESLMDDRRAYFESVRELHNGTDAVIRMLNHHQVQVVLNVAELLGEIREESAVPALTEALSHYDERVQKAAAGALASIGTAATVEGVRKALDDTDPELRAMVARTAGRQSRALTAPIVEAMDDEENPVVQAEYYRALGRIGAADAVQALIKAAQPSGRLTRKKKPVGQRLAAIEGLKLAGGPAAYKALESLSDDDPEAEVRDAARLAAQEMKRRPAASAE